MAPTNDFLPFCPTDTGTNLLNQGQYIASPNLPIGNQPGVASSKLNNKVLRQASVIASQVAQLVSNMTGGDMLDDGTTAAMIARMTAALAPKLPIRRQFLSGSGNCLRSNLFTIASGNATVGATYTNNAVTFTVSATVAGATQVIMTGSGSPLASGTLTKASGTGDATLTFYAVAIPLYARLQMAASGGGGSNGSANTPGAGGGSGEYLEALISSPTASIAYSVGASVAAQTDGIDTTFGANTAKGGKGTSTSVGGRGGQGGTVGLGTGISLEGGGGGAGGVNNTWAMGGGTGGSSFFGGGGLGQGGTSQTGGTGGVNTGGGGGGGNASAGAGGPSGSGIIFYEEHFQ